MRRICKHRPRPLGDIPLAVLEHGRPFDLPPGLPRGFGSAIERAWHAAQVGLARLVPGARRIVARRSGHYIQLEQPALVSAEIRRVVDAARRSSAG